jgi:hypothetical protein
MNLDYQVPRNNVEISVRTLAIALIPPIGAAIISGWLIGFCVLGVEAMAKTTFAAVLGLIAIYYLQLRTMFECKRTWFGEWDPSKAPSETVTPLDEEKAFLRMIEEEG